MATTLRRVGGLIVFLSHIALLAVSLFAALSGASTATVGDAVQEVSTTTLHALFMGIVLLAWMGGTITYGIFLMRDGTPNRWSAGLLLLLFGFLLYGVVTYDDASSGIGVGSADLTIGLVVFLIVPLIQLADLLLPPYHPKAAVA